MKIKPERNFQGILVPLTTNKISFSNRIDHFLARWGYKRNNHRINPGLYILNNPNADSPVFVTANYTLSFDAVRSSLVDVDCFLLVLDTKGVNVWCAAGKGTFGTDELVNRIKATSLSEIVKHRKLILPQLGGPGVASHEVKKRSGFKVEYGPVRASDLPEFLKNNKVTKEMRRVHFTFKDRLLLVPVETVSMFLPMLLIALVLYFIGGPVVSAATVLSILAATILFPLLLPWIPTPNFSTKGFILGGIVAISFAIFQILANPDAALWQKVGWALAYLLALPPITAFLSLNFTGATTFTSKSGVKHEMFIYIPVMAWMFGIGLFISITFSLIRVIGVYL
jgi:hypothetical protein